VYIGWVDHGNLGDEAMFDVCKEVFPEIVWTPLRRLHRENPSFVDRGIRFMHRLANRRGDEVGILGGGTLIGGGASWTAQYLALRKRVGRPVPVFSPGVEDPVFAPGNERWSEECAAWIDALRDLPVVGVRGPRSMPFLREAGLKNVRVTGDPVVAMHRGLVPATSPARHRGDQRRAV
jgi:hypothetical protein